MNPISPPAAGTSASDIYLVAAHPDWRQSRVNARLLAAARPLQRVDTNDLYSTYPDYCMDVPREQRRLESARLVVLMHPVHWYAMPALLKLWLDDVLTFGWAYGGGTALQGKDLWLVATTGGPESSYHPESYNRYFFDAFLPPCEQTAALCGMRFLPPLILHGAHSASEAELAEHVELFRNRLQSYPDWPEIRDMAPDEPCAVPDTDRPAPARPSADTPAEKD